MATNFDQATFSGFRKDLPDGRVWRVNDRYNVVVWVDAEQGRLASCQCAAYSYGQLCRHIRFVAGADSHLTGAPRREIQKAA